MAVSDAGKIVLTVEDIKSFSIEKDIASDTVKHKQLIAVIKLPLKSGSLKALVF